MDIIQNIINKLLLNLIFLLFFVKSYVFHLEHNMLIITVNTVIIIAIKDKSYIFLFHPCL